MTAPEPTVDFESFLNTIRSSPVYRNQIVHTHVVEAREAEFASATEPLSEACSRFLTGLGIERLYSHQALALDAVRRGQDVLVVTGTASGKSLCYQLPLIEMLERDTGGTGALLFPTKALAQDQFQSTTRALSACGMPESLAAVYDGDTPAAMRRKLRDEAALILTNPDMLHAALMPQHTRWADFLQRLRIVVVDELHTYSGLFGSNAANLFRRFERVCSHYGARPLFIFCSATIGNPAEVAAKLTGRRPTVIDQDGSPRGKKTYVFWNPPRVRDRRFKTRRSANVEAHELMTELLRTGRPTVTFSKAKITAELIYRYVRESLERTAPHLARKVTPYRGGYLPEERREIERRLWSGDLIGVSTTRALELGIDVGALDASIIVGYPGTLAGFFQQSGRAGRRERESLAVLVGLDTSVNQYVMKHPEYVFGRPLERIVLDPDNPYVLSGQLRCAAYELPIREHEAPRFGPYARVVLDILTEHGKLNKVGDRWYHASDDVPEHEVSLRDICDRNVTITDIETGRVIGELNKFDAQSIIHPDAIYIHQGETYLVLELDLQSMHCYVKKVETDYYTQPIGGTDVHHIDQPLRQRDFGCSKAYFGEVTAYFKNSEYERIHFYELDAVSRHPLNMPTYQLETMAFWITPNEELVRELVSEGIDVHRALMGVGYATRMILPLFIQCETLDFSHSSCTAVNAPWHTVFVYERYPHGLGFTWEAYEILADVITAVRDHVLACECADGCPCCVGKPLRGYTTWNVERGEASIPSKRATLRLLHGIIGDGTRLRARDADSLGCDTEEKRLLMERGIRRRLERLADPEVFHPIDPIPQVGFPRAEPPTGSTESDVSRRAFRRMGLDRRVEAGEKPPHGSIDALQDAGRFWRTPDYLKSFGGEAGASPKVGPQSGSEEEPPTDTSRVARQGSGTAESDLDHERVSPAPRSQARALRDLMRGRAPERSGQDRGQADSLPSDSGENDQTDGIRLGDPIASMARKLRKRGTREDA